MKGILCLALCGLLALAMAEKVKYNNYKVFRVIPQTEEQRSLLLDLEKNNPGFLFWKHTRNVGLPVDIMVPPHLLPMMSESFPARGLVATEMVKDVQSLIDIEEMSMMDASPKLSWTAYHSVAEIHEYMHEMADKHPAVASVEKYGESYEGRDLLYMYINKGASNKPTVWVDCNIHAREWITNPICTWKIKELLEGDDVHQAWLNDFNFYVVPMMNPDGYEYTRSVDRMWRKTRTNLAGGMCLGADPNRNFAFDWNTGGSSNNPCVETFMGVSAMSEPEVRAAANQLEIVHNDTANPLVGYLSMHSYSQLILIGYGTNRGRISDYQEHMTLGNAVKNAIATKFSTNYTPGNIVDLLYVASGSSGDHAKGFFDVDITYTFEMRDTGRYGFILPADQIIPSCQEYMDGFNVIMSHLKTKHAP